MNTKQIAAALILCGVTGCAAPSTLLVDQQGPFGSPISDSMRTRVTGECKRILWVTFAPAGAKVPNAEFAETMIRFNGGVTKVAKEL